MLSGLLPAGLSRSGLLRDVAVAVAALALFLVLPMVFPAPALRDFLIYFFAYGLLAMSLNLLVGLTGLVSFGHAAYFATGAYAFGILMQTGRVSIPLAMLAAIGGTALVALVIGAICVRLKEIYFSFITLAFQMFIHSVIVTWVSLTGGDQGLRGGIPRPPVLGLDLNDARVLYGACAVVFVLCILAMRQVSQSPFGYTLRMIRDNPVRANFLGVDVTAMKLGIFVFAAAMASVGGLILALFVSGAYPEFAFWTTSGEAIFMIMLGGTTIFLGPLVGTLLLQTLNHFVTIYTEHHGLVLGTVILVIVLGLRRGLADVVYDGLRNRRARRAAAAEPAPESAAPAPLPDGALDSRGV
ncbi:branched-chain amino acid ABC transporter permease [Methylobacterium sp. EM32]|uniref:branched-chain amino acid ABC transporter permease n=1 Tax=Methylobacterium sp. EM32 TaxID=3163481 RepID=UPI0033B93A0C